MAKKSIPTPETGNFYENTRYESVYFLTKVVGKYVLIALNDIGYWASPCDNIEDVFGYSKEDFAYIENVTITATRIP